MRAVEQQAETSPLARCDERIAGWRFRPHWAAAGGHLQTILGSLWRRTYGSSVTEATEQLIETEPGTTVLVRCSWHEDRERRPTALIVHGLEGSDESCYMRGTAEKAFAAGWNAVRLNLRNCGGTEHLSPTLYNSGLTGDVTAVLRHLVANEGARQVGVVGFSLGGNLVLKMAGELGEAATDERHRVVGVVAVSPAVDLSAAAARLEAVPNWLYHARFVLSLHKRLRVKHEFFPDRIDLSKLRGSYTIRDYDTKYIAPMFGFRDAEDYYERASARELLRNIAVPTLMLHADDDPFIPLTTRVRQAAAGNPNIRIVTVSSGGHVGFVASTGASRAAREDRHWAENRCIEFLDLMLYDRSAPIAALSR